MRVIEAPNHAHIRPTEVSVFIAGGITDCPNWQQDVIRLFEENLGRSQVALLNPRRKNFPIERKSESKVQIEWEFDHNNFCPLQLIKFPFNLYFGFTLSFDGKILAGHKWRY